MTPAEKRRLKAFEARIDKGVGKAVRDRREKLSILQDELGTTLGVSGATMSRYEKGANSLRPGQLRMLARRLNCTVAELFDGEKG